MKKSSIKAEALTSSDFEVPKPKILLFDIETAPNLAYVWAHWEQNVLGYVQERYMLSFSAKWLGEEEVIVKSLPDYKGYKPHKDCDKGLVQDLWKLFDEADIIIGHNLDSFDIKMANARFINYGIDPPRFYRTIDTRNQARKFFRFNSNKLNDLGKFLGVGEKMKHQGFEMWVGCLAGDAECWDTMVKYNIQDVLLLERVYLKLRQWMSQHPNMNVLLDRENGCAKCGSSNVVKRGYIWTNLSRAVRFFCKDCRGYSQSQYKKVASQRSA